MDAALGGKTHEAVADFHKALLADKQEEIVTTSKSEPTVGAASGIQEHSLPGGFRREFLQRGHDSDSSPMPSKYQTPLLKALHPLIRVGYFDSVLGIRLNDDGEEMSLEKGEVGVPQTILALAKSFVGSGITFLPGAFVQGGWVFSTVVILIIGICNGVCIWLLLECSIQTGLSGFGDIAHKAAGGAAKQAVHVSLVITQFGTNVAYMIFISQMAGSLGAHSWVSNEELILLMLVIIIPLSFIRSIHRMEFAILGADALVVFGLGVVVWYATKDLVAQGTEPSIQSFSPSTCGLFVGTAVFTFEGIPFILPIRSSMEKPDKFGPIFAKVFICIVVFFAAFGYIGYADYGSQTQAVILLNLPEGQILVTFVRLAYMVALLLGSPMVFLPAARITELWIFGIVKPKGSRKWQKNALRTIEMCFLGIVANYGGKYFDIFLAFVGALCCAPIAFIYPAFFHLRLCAKSNLTRCIDCCFVMLGFAAMAFVLYQTVSGL